MTIRGPETVSPEVLLEPPDTHASIVPAESKGIAQGDVDLHIPRLVGDVVQITRRIGVVKIDRGCQDPAARHPTPPWPTSPLPPAARQLQIDPDWTYPRPDTRLLASLLGYKNTSATTTAAL